MPVRLLAAAGVLLALGGRAAAGGKDPPPYVDRTAGFQVLVPAGWQPVTLAEPPREVLLLCANDATGQVFVVSKIVGPSEGIEKDPKPFLAGVEQGIKNKSTGYKRISAKQRSLGRVRKVPGWDLWFRVERDGKPVTMAARFLFFRGYAISVMVDAPARAQRKEARRIVESFGPIDPVAPAPR